MKNYSLKPTEETIRELFCNNITGRNDAVYRLVELLQSIDDSFTIAINGEWGSGKTFFTKQVKMALDYLNKFSSMDIGTREYLEKHFKKTFHEFPTYSTVYYDAWLNDNQEDPILSLIYVALQSMAVTNISEKQYSIGKTLCSIATAISGRNISDVFKNLKGEEVFAGIKKADDIQPLTKALCDAVINEHGVRLGIFLDELERCKPDYAVRFLERIKHYLNDDRVTFVFSVNLSQLQWTIKKYYGENFSATKYLDKFFDLHVDLPSVDIEEYIRIKFQISSGYYCNDTVCVETIQYFHLSLREMERYIRLIKIAGYQYSHNAHGGSLEFVISYIIPILIGLKMYDVDAYNNFIHGTNISPMLDILQKSEKSIRRWRRDAIPTKQFLQEVYDALFGLKINRANQEVMVDGLIFDKEIKKDVEQITGLLSSYCNYAFE